MACELLRNISLFNDTASKQPLAPIEEEDEYLSQHSRHTNKSMLRNGGGNGTFMGQGANGEGQKHLFPRQTTGAQANSPTNTITTFVNSYF